MPINNAFDAFELFKKHGAAFEAAGTFTEFCAAPGLKYLEMYAGGWAEQAFKTAKAGKMSVYRPLAFPTAAQFTDLFTAAYFLPASIDAHGATVPRGAHFVSGSRGSAAPCGHMGGRRGWSERTPDTRAHYGAKFYGSYAIPSDDVAAAVESYLGHKDYSFEAIGREDGILITARAGNCIGEVWLALLDHGETLESMFDAATREFIANEKQAAIDAWGDAE